MEDKPIGFISRSSGLFLLIVAVTILLVQPVAASSNPAVPGVPPSGPIVFNVFMEGDKVGQDKITFNYNGDTLIAERTVELNYSFAYINFLDYRHQSRGYWRNGVLQELTAHTNNNGDKHRVVAERQDDKMVILKGDTPGRTAERVLPTSWWNPAIRSSTVLLDTQFGQFRRVAVEAVDRDRRRKGNKQVMADHYRVTGDLNLQLWYGPDRELVGIEFVRRDYTFTYERIE